MWVVSGTLNLRASMPTLVGKIGTGQTFVWASLSLGREICGRKETRPKQEYMARGFFNIFVARECLCS